MVFMDTNNPHVLLKPQLASAVVANLNSLLQNWPQVCLGGHAERRNREPHDKLGALGFECQSPDKALWEEKK